MEVLQALHSVTGDVDNKIEQLPTLPINDWFPPNRLKVESHICDSGSIYRASGSSSNSAPLDVRPVFRQAEIEKAVTYISDKLSGDCERLLRVGEAAVKKASMS